MGETMPLDMSSFGALIASARRQKELSQKEVAALIHKEDGEPISPQYLNDIEHDRRSPSSDHLLKQFAKALGVESAVLYSAIGMLTEEDRKLVKKASSDKISSAYLAFRKKLEG
jgi:transcriptional regulator with XRE-family HTH domain